MNSNTPVLSVNRNSDMACVAVESSAELQEQCPACVIAIIYKVASIEPNELLPGFSWGGCRGGIRRGMVAAFK